MIKQIIDRCHHQLLALHVKIEYSELDKIMWVCGVGVLQLQCNYNYNT